MERKRPVTLRLDRAVRLRLARIARRKGTTPSELMRDAIERWVAAEEGEARSLHEAIADLVGCTRGGVPGRSAGGGRALSERLRARRRHP